MTEAAPRVRTRTRPEPARQLDVADNEGLLEVRRTRYGSEQETIVSQKIFVPTFPVPPAHVSVKVSETINMGDYNSVRVECSLHMPVLPEMSEIERVKTLCAETVDRWMEVETARATGQSSAWENPSQ